MYSGYTTATVEFEERTIIVDVVALGGMIGDWKARDEDDREFLLDATGFERAFSRALDSENGVGEYKGFLVTLA